MKIYFNENCYYNDSFTHASLLLETVFQGYQCGP